MATARASTDFTTKQTYLDDSLSTNPSMDTDPCSALTWIYITNSDVKDFVFQAGGTGTNTTVLQKSATTDKPQSRIGGTITAGATSLTSNVWSHIGCSFGGGTSTVRIYLAGVSVGS